MVFLLVLTFEGPSKGNMHQVYGGQLRIRPSQWMGSVLLVFFSAFVLLVGWQEGHLACKKLEWWGAGMIICLERGADLHMAQLMPLPLTVSCFSKIQIGFTFLVPAYPGSPRQRSLNGRAHARVCFGAEVYMTCKIVSYAQEFSFRSGGGKTKAVWQYWLIQVYLESGV